MATSFGTLSCSGNETNNPAHELDSNLSEQDSLPAPCTLVCDHLLLCIAELVCVPTLGELDHDGCVSDCTARGDMNESSAAQYVTQSCDDVNRGQCSANPEQFANCECPSTPVGNCPEGQFCSVPLTDSNGNSLFACGDESGGPPDGAATCSEAAPSCVDDKECILFNTEESDGYCLAMCER